MTSFVGRHHRSFVFFNDASWRNTRWYAAAARHGGAFSWANIRIMIVAFSVAPTTATDDDGGVADAVAEAVRIVRESGLPNETNAMFTLIEGEWDDVFDVVKRATEAVSTVSPRTSLVIKADIRPGFTGQLTAKVDAVNRRLASS